MLIIALGFSKGSGNTAIQYNFTTEGRPRHEIGWFSMSPLHRLHHHDIMAIVELFFIYVLFVTIRHVMMVC